MWLKNLIQGTPKAAPIPPHSMVMLLREPVVLDKAFVVAAAERGWKRPFAGGESFWYVVPATKNLANVSADGLFLSVLHSDYFDADDDNVTNDLPALAERNLWPPHKARIVIDCTISNPAKLELARGSVARMVLGLMDANCVGFFDGHTRVFAPASPEALSELERLTLAAPVDSTVS